MASNSKTIEVIGSDSGWGCRDYGCQDGPAAVRPDPVVRELATRNIDTVWTGPLGFKSLANRSMMSRKDQVLPHLVNALNILEKTVRRTAESGRIPVVIGGDHSAAAATWSGVTGAHGMQKKFGLVWFDAHEDAHTPKTEHEGKWGGWLHGQPVSALLGEGRHELTTLGGDGAKLLPQNVSLIGCHSYEPGEDAFLRDRGVRVYKLDEVKARGLDVVFKEAMQRATRGTDGFGLSVDLDAVRAIDAPGVGTPEGDGLVATDLLRVVKGAGLMKNFKALEIMELNPHNDRGGKTARLVQDLITHTFG